MWIELAIITPLVIAGAIKREAADEVDRSNYPTIVQSWKAPAGFDKYNELQQCLSAHGHRIRAAHQTRTTYISEGVDEKGRTQLTITRWKPEPGDIQPRSVPTTRTKALQCVFEDGKLWNARLSQFNGTWIAANLPQEAD